MARPKVIATIGLVFYCTFLRVETSRTLQLFHRIYNQWRGQEFSMGSFEALSRILTSMLSLMTRLRKAVHTFVSKERKLYQNYSMSPIPQKIANCSLRGLTVSRPSHRSFMKGSIHGWSRSHLTYAEAHPGFGKEGAQPGIWGIRPSGVTRVPCAPAFTPNFAQNRKMTVKFGVSFELLMNRGLEKNNKGERLTKQETKKSGEISDAFRIWLREATSKGLEAKPPAAGGYGGLGAQPPASNGFLGFLQEKHSI